MRPNKNIFPLTAILAQKQLVESNKSIQGQLNYGYLVNEKDKGVTFKLQNRHEINVLDYYPHADEDDLTGCVTIVELPQLSFFQERDSLGNEKEYHKIPKGVYMIMVDPYYKDDAEDKTSLGVAVVYKLKSRYFDDKTDREVAWFVGRPNRAEDFYQSVLDLADFYNATIQSELQGGGKGLHDYAKVRKKLNRLEFAPLGANAKEIEIAAKNRSYFMDLQDDDKRLGLQYYADWLKTPIGLDENGNEIWNLHYIYDLGVLRELLLFNDKGNFDRISARVVGQHMLKENVERRMSDQREKTRRSIIGKRALFSNKTETNRVRHINAEGVISW